MSDVLRFLATANPATGVGLVPRAQGLPIVVLVVDDSKDDELSSLLASGDSVVASELGGTWSAQVNGEQLVIKFHLISRDGAWERQWTYPDPGGGVLDAITSGGHHVAILPAVGDLSEFVRKGSGGGIIVDAKASRAIASAYAVASQVRQPGAGLPG